MYIYIATLYIFIRLFFLLETAEVFSQVFAFAAGSLLKISETPRFGGETLVFMALDDALQATSGRFFSVHPGWVGVVGRWVGGWRWGGA